MARFLLGISLSFFSSQLLAATDSYRWLHVTIETPWAIFIFLLPMVLLPAVLMAILYWKYAGKKKSANDVNSSSATKNVSSDS